MKRRRRLDTGAFARRVLGFDYDKNPRTGVITRPGGIRASGPHRDITRLLDAPSRRKLVLSPRGSFKSSILTAFCLKAALDDRDLRILYGMETYSNAIAKIRAIKQQIETNPRIAEYAGVDSPADLKGKPWGQSSFCLAGRTRVAPEPTFSAFGVDKVVTGGHYDIIVLDDLVSHLNSRTPEGLQKVWECYQFVEPLLDPGGILVVVGTRYEEGDLYDRLMQSEAISGTDENRRDWDVINLHAGVDLIQDEEGWKLVGEPAFAHLDLDFLAFKLRSMGPAKFSSQYLNTIISTGEQIFSRTQFHSTTWQEWMRELACFIITDTAVAQNDDACYSVVGLVGLDPNRRAYLLDLRVGHWSPHRFVENFFKILLSWRSRVRIHAAAFERTSLTRVFRPMISEEARIRGVSVHFVEISRGTGDPSKKQRIQSLHSRFERGDFVVVHQPADAASGEVPGVPRTYEDLGETKLLFDPAGWVEEDGSRLPDGELVRQFLYFAVSNKKDIPDAIADIDATERDGSYIFCGASRAAWERKASPYPEPGAPRTHPRSYRTRVGSGSGSGSLWSGLARRGPGSRVR